MANRNSNLYKYTTLILAIILILVVASFLSYDFGYKMGTQQVVCNCPDIPAGAKTAPGPGPCHCPIAVNQTTSTTQTTVLSSVQCSNQHYTSVSVGNSLTCGSFSAKVEYVNSTNVTLQIYYNGAYVNQSVFGRNMQKAFSFSSSVTYGIYMAGPIPSNQSAYFIIDSGYVTCTTVTIPTIKTTSTVTTTMPSTIASSLSSTTI